jgi:hypothetical protein
MLSASEFQCQCVSCPGNATTLYTRLDRGNCLAIRWQYGLNQACRNRNLYLSDTKLVGCKSSCESLQSLAVLQSRIERIRGLLCSEIDGGSLEGEPAETVQAMPGVLRQNNDSEAEDSDAFVATHTGVVLMKTSS